MLNKILYECFIFNAKNKSFGIDPCYLWTAQLSLGNASLQHYSKMSHCNKTNCIFSQMGKTQISVRNTKYENIS